MANPEGHRERNPDAEDPENSELATGGLDNKFNITFSSELSPQQVRATLEALADYYRACGGVGFEVDFDLQDVLVRELSHA